MKYCPICERNYGDNISLCEIDGSTLRDSRPASDAFIGKIIKGRYRVIEKLGEGGMAVVYLAEQINVERKAALKILHGHYANDQEFVGRFRQEAKLAASLNHPNLITVYDFDQADDGSLFIAMEYLHGKNLKEVIQTGRVDVAKGVRLAIQIAEGLLSAHRAGVIHRDIKPENIMVVGGGNEIKLMDFGIARLRETSAATRLTRAGMIMGTPLYMAPEQIEGGEVTEKTDIYAFGIVLYEMLSGSAPFRAPTPAAVLMKHLKEIPPPLRKLRGEIPAAVEKVVSRALEKKPERRPATMAEIVESLRSIEARLPRTQIAKTLMMTQPLESIPHEGEEPRGVFGALVAEIKDSGVALFRGLMRSKPSKDNDQSEANAVTPFPSKTSAVGWTMGETVALPQVSVRPQEKSKLPWTWIGVGAGVVVLAGLAVFIGGNLERPADKSASGGATTPSTSEAVTAKSDKVITMAVRGEKQEVGVGERVRLSLNTRYADGRETDVRDGVEWRSSDEAVATIREGGELEGRKGGKVDVTARFDGMDAAALSITVKEPVKHPIPAKEPVKPSTAAVARRTVSVAIIGGRNEISVGARALFRAKAKYSDGTEEEVKKDIRWQSSNPSIVSVNAGGEVTGRNEGRAAITAFFDRASSEPLAMIVTPPPKRQEPQTASEPISIPTKADVTQYVRAAKSYRDRGAYTEALVELQKARQIDPNNRDVQEEIAATRRACNAEKRLGQSNLNCS
jgi:serine/threonine protein kinase